jgi:hypothetical protein
MLMARKKSGLDKVPFTAGNIMVLLGYGPKEVDSFLDLYLKSKTKEELKLLLRTPLYGKLGHFVTNRLNNILLDDNGNIVGFGVKWKVAANHDLLAHSPYEQFTYSRDMFDLVGIDAVPVPLPEYISRSETKERTGIKLTHSLSFNGEHFEIILEEIEGYSLTRTILLTDKEISGYE